MATWSVSRYEHLITAMSTLHMCLVCIHHLNIKVYITQNAERMYGDIECFVGIYMSM